MWGLFLLVCIILAAYISTRRDKRMVLLYKQMPCDIPQLPIIGHVHKFMGDGERLMTNMKTLGRETTKHGGLMGLWHLNTLYLMVSDADTCAYILKHCLTKGDMMELTWIVLGNASVFAPVPIWRPRRKLHISNFNQKRLNGFVEIFSKHGQVLVEKLKLLAGEEPLSLSQHLNGYALDAVCETIMGINVDAQNNPNNPFLIAVTELLRLAAERISKPWLYSDFICNLFYYKFKEYKATIYDFIKKLIEERRKLLEMNRQAMSNDNNGENNSLKFFVDNMINMMSHLSNDDQETVNLLLQEEILVLIGAGTETSAVASLHILAMLSRCPLVQEKVYQELQTVFGDTNRPIVVDDLPHLKYLEAVIKETMRLYPPIPMIVRKIDNDVTLPSGTTLVKGCGIFINIWAVNRNPLYWGADAEEFRPERFLEGPLTHPAANITFSYGPRGCIGNQFANISLKTTIASIVRQFRLLPAPDSVTGAIPTSDEPLKLKFEITAKQPDNFTLRLEKRT